MLNNIRGMLNRRNDPSKSPESLLPRTSSEDNDDSTGSNEGFLCPTCFRSFPSDIALQDHYETTHLESEISGDRRGTLSCPACKMKLGTESELNSHYARHHSSPKEQEELEAMSLQVKALEEGKALLQGELKAFRLQASELSRENALVREERDSFKLKANKLTDDLANLKLGFDELKARKESIESSFQASEDKVKKLSVEIQQRPEADDVNVLQKELVSVQKIMNDLTHQREVEKEMLQKQCNSVQETCKKLQAEKLELENAMKTFPRKEEVMSLQNKVKELTKNINDTQKQLEKISGEKKALEDKLQKCSNYDEIKSLLSTKENALEESMRISSEKDVLIAKLNSEIKTTKESIEEMKTGRDKLFSKIQEGEGASAAMIELKEENIRLQDRFVLQQEMHVEAMNEADTKIEELRSSFKKTTYLLKESNEKCEELEKSLTQSQNQVQELLHQKDSLLKEINSQTETLNENESTYKKQIDELSVELSNRSLSLEEKNLQIENLKNQLKKKKGSKFYVSELSLSQNVMECKEKSSFEKTCEKLDLEKQSFEKRLSELGDTLPSVQADLLDKNNKLMEAEKKLQQMGEKLKLKEKEGTDKQDELNQLYLLYESATSKIEKMEKAMNDFETDKTEFLEKISSLNEDLLKSKMKETELVDDVERMNKNQIQIQEKCLSLEEENKNLRNSITTLQNEKNSLLSEIEKERKAFGDLNDINNANLKKLKELTDSCQKEKANAEKILQDASVEKEVYLKDKMKLQKQLENLENDCAKQLSQFQETVKKLEVQLEEAEEKSAALKSSLEESNEYFKRKEKEWEGKEAHHIAQVGLLTENIQTLRDDLSSEQKLKESLKQKLNEISGTKLELEAKLENALDERRGLLERCLKSETECERLQKSASEMRRKYDDCVAALQELGRENQTLQVENMKHITRKWADDSEVTNCTACGKMFSVTIRKHHCRNCGDIFCNECSAKCATVAASKKPVRVCDICYLEVTK